MIEDLVYAEENKDAIMGVMRSAVVCLHTLLKTNNKGISVESFEQELFQCCSRDIDSSQENQDSSFNKNSLIVELLPELLFADHFDGFRQNFVKELYANNMEEDARCFEERLKIARSLPPETKEQVKGIIDTLKAGAKKTGEFFNWLFSSLMDNEHNTTQNACIELICDYFPNIMHSHHGHHHGHHHSHHDHESHPTYEVANLGVDSYLWGDIPYGRATEQQLEIVNQRIRVVQALNSGVVDQEQPDHVWKLKDPNESCPVTEISKILAFSTYCQGEDFSEKLSSVIAKDYPSLREFKHNRLVKLKFA